MPIPPELQPNNQTPDTYSETPTPVPESSQQTVEAEPAPVESYESVSRSTEAEIKEQAPDFMASSHIPGHTNEFLSLREKSIVQGWVGVAFEKGRAVAIKQAKDYNNPALLDEFHAALTGELYQQMIDQGKLEVVK